MFFLPSNRFQGALYTIAETRRVAAIEIISKVVSTFDPFYFTAAVLLLFLFCHYSIALHLNSVCNNAI